MPKEMPEIGKLRVHAGIMMTEKERALLESDQEKQSLISNEMLDIGLKERKRLGQIQIYGKSASLLVLCLGAGVIFWNSTKNGADFWEYCLLLSFGLALRGDTISSFFNGILQLMKMRK